MRLVHGDGLHAGTTQHRHRRPRGQPFRRHVQKPQFARVQGADDFGVLILGIAAGQGGGGDARLGQRADLVRISAISGEITTVSPSRISAGS